MTNVILVAIDANDEAGAKKVAAQAALLAKATGAKLHAITVVPDSGMAIVGAALGPEHSDKVMRATQDSMNGFLGEHLPEAELHVVFGSIYDSIIRTADSLHAELIIIGSHRPELRDYLVGPNAAKVARHAQQSVLIVR